MFYFLLSPYNGPTKANYQHSCILLAEGLKKLDQPFGANIDYFPDANGVFTIPKVDYTDQEYIITSAPEEFEETINRLLQLPHRKLIIIDTKDEWVRPKSAKYLSRAHRYFVSTARVATRIIMPWAFALTNRMIDAARPTPWALRNPAIAWTHRVDNHELRNRVKAHYDQRKIPYDTYLDNFKVPEGDDVHYWDHTGRRHSYEYFEFIGNHKVLDAHGGYSSNLKEIVQWDSWKVWEGFAAGCLVVTADLDYYRVILPFPLIPFTHYIPIRYDQLDASYDKLSRLPDAEQEKIAAAGRAFVLEHYTPATMAAYMFKNTIN
jgi:hypothetical protein